MTQNRQLNDNEKTIAVIVGSLHQYSWDTAPINNNVKPYTIVILSPTVNMAKRLVHYYPAQVVTKSANFLTLHTNRSPSRCLPSAAHLWM